MQAAAARAAQVDWRLYFVTDSDQAGGRDRLPWVVGKAIEGGVSVVQIRDKTATDYQFRKLTEHVVDVVESTSRLVGRHIELFINDRLEVARDFRLSLHVGQADATLTQARSELGDQSLVGLSVSNPTELRDGRRAEIADVVGLSPVWSTDTKTDTAPALGLTGTRELVTQAAGLPTVAIGGINLSNAKSVIDTGVAGICVVSAIATASNPRQAAEQLLACYDVGENLD